MLILENMKDNELMRIAIDEAKKSTEPLRCGVVIAKEGQIISQTYNAQRKNFDATAHAEIIAIREAGNKLQQKSLDGCIAYCSCEPCAMCLSAMVLAKIDKIYFAANLEEVVYIVINIPSDEIIKNSARETSLIKNFMRNEALKELYPNKLI